MTKRILVTGGAGFAGHHFVEHLMKNTDWEIVVFDVLNYAASGFDRLRDIDVYDDTRVLALSSDFSKRLTVGARQEIGDVDYILHMGAETHVDNSIKDPIPFVNANVLGTAYMLEFARQLDNLERFIYFSTDEVFGPAKAGVSFKEWDRYNSGNPYAATKAGGEELALAYANTYGIPMMITHTMNMFGERQHPEKFIPLVIRKVMKGDVVTIHSDETKTKAGVRSYIHCRNVAAAVLFLLESRTGQYTYTRDKFNIVGEEEIDNLSLAQFIASAIGRDLNYEMVDYHSSRPGHDLRYALDGTKMREMGWDAPVGFYDSLLKTIKWTLERPEWYELNE